MAFFSRIRHHITNPESYHRRIASSFLLVSAFVLIGRLAGAAKEMAIAWRYGISEIVDAYVLVFSLISWPVSVWFSVLSIVLVPLLARLKVNSATNIQQFRNEVFGFTIVLGIILSILIYFSFPYILSASWTGLTISTQHLADNFATGLAPIALMGIVINLFSAWMLANGHHRNTLFEAIPALVILVVLFLPPSWMTEPLLWGTLIGVALQLVALSIPLMQRNQLQMPCFTFQSPAWKGFWNAIGVLAISQTLMSFSTIIDQFTAANLGVGAISTLSYSNRVLALLLSLGAMAIGRAVLPVFSDMHAKREGDLKKTALQWCGWMFLLGLGVCLIFWILSPWVIAILFERGQFSATDTQSVSDVLRWGLIQVPFFYAGLVLVQLLASHERYNIIAFFTVTNLFIKIIGNLFLPDLMGVSGIALSTGLMYVWSTACLYIASRRVI